MLVRHSAKYPSGFAKAASTCFARLFHMAKDLQICDFEQFQGTMKCHGCTEKSRLVPPFELRFHCDGGSAFWSLLGKSPLPTEQTAVLDPDLHFAVQQCCAPTSRPPSQDWIYARDKTAVKFASIWIARLHGWVVLVCGVFGLCGKRRRLGVNIPYMDPMGSVLGPTKRYVYCIYKNNYLLFIICIYVYIPRYIHTQLEHLSKILIKTSSWSFLFQSCLTFNPKLSSHIYTPEN